MATFADIIARAFRDHAHFTIAGEVVVTFPEDEVIQVNVGRMTFVMTCGSDDDRFYFTCINEVTAPVEFAYPGDINDFEHEDWTSPASRYSDAKD